MVDFARDQVVFPDGSEGTITRLSRLTDGRVMCCICFEYRHREDLFVDNDGDVWDYCKGQCAAAVRAVERDT